jgi:hypothetical protein
LPQSAAQAEAALAAVAYRYLARLLAVFLVQLAVMLLPVEIQGAAAAEQAAAAAVEAVAQGVMQHLKQHQPHTHLLQQVYQSPLVNRSSSSRVQFWVGWAGLVKCSILLRKK